MILFSRPATSIFEILLDNPFLTMALILSIAIVVAWGFIIWYYRPLKTDVGRAKMRMAHPGVRCIANSRTWLDFSPAFYLGDSGSCNRYL